MRAKNAGAAIALAALAAGGAACGSDGDGGAATSGPAATVALPQGAEPSPLRPADFAGRIDNPWWPMAPGNRWVYRETDGHGGVARVVVTVTGRTKTIEGVAATVVHDVVSEAGEVVEDTHDWYAQDRAGNIWYLGEATAEYEDGHLKTRKGSWEAGVHGAQAGIIIPADPQPGLTYRQEYLEGEAEDRAEVQSLDATAESPYGTFHGALETRDTTPLEPDLVEHKLYARGIGPVVDVAVSGGSDREVLLSFRRGRP